MVSSFVRIFTIDMVRVICVNHVDPEQTLQCQLRFYIACPEKSTGRKMEILG